MSEVILTKNCKTSQKDPPPQKKVATFSKGANDNTMTITWLQLWDRFLIFTIVLVLCSCTTNIWSRINTTWQLCYCIFQKGPQEKYYNPAETLVNGHFLGAGESWISRWKRFGCWETDLCWGTFNLPVQFSLLILSSWGTGGNIDHPIDTESITAKNNHFWPVS